MDLAKQLLMLDTVRGRIPSRKRFFLALFCHRAGLLGLLNLGTKMMMSTINETCSMQVSPSGMSNSGLPKNDKQIN